VKHNSLVSKEANNARRHLDQKVHAAAGRPLQKRVLTTVLGHYDNERETKPKHRRLSNAAPRNSWMGAMIETIVYLSFVTASVSFTVTEAKICGRFRAWAKEKNLFLGELLSCGYCFGHWVAFALVAVYRPRLFYAWWPLDFFLTALVIAWLAGLQLAGMCLLLEKAGK